MYLKQNVKLKVKINHPKISNAIFSSFKNMIQTFVQNLEMALK